MALINENPCVLHCTTKREWELNDKPDRNVTAMKTDRRNDEVRQTIYRFDGVNNYRVSTTRTRIYRGKCIIDNRDSRF